MLEKKGLNNEKKEQSKPKQNRRKEKTNVRTEINKIFKLDETKSWFFGKMNNIHKTLNRLIKKEEKTSVTNIRRLLWGRG